MRNNLILFRYHSPQFEKRIEISCNVLEDNISANIIRLLENINYRNVNILIDPRSYHIFIYNDNAMKLIIHIQPIKLFRVTTNK